MDFQTFKNLYGHNDQGLKNVKFGNDLVQVDNKNYTITNVDTNKENEARKRLLAGTLSSNQRQIKNPKGTFLPEMKQLRSTTGTALANIKEKEG